MKDTNVFRSAMASFSEHVENIKFCGVWIYKGGITGSQQLLWYSSVHWNAKLKRVYTVGFCLSPAL